MLKIQISTVPHSRQRYPTCGDWLLTDARDGLHVEIKVSELSDWRRELLVAAHELIEVALLAHKHGTVNTKVIQRLVDEFDIAYEKERDEGLHGIAEEPGDDPHAPYRTEHFFATNLERLLAAEFDINWHNYEAEIVSL